MRKRTKNSLLATAVVVLAMTLGGCHTMHFDHTGDGAGNNELSEWHHGGILQLVEFSDPVDLESRCGGESAKAHTVKQSFLNGLASSISYGLYVAWTVEIDCP